MKIIGRGASKGIVIGTVVIAFTADDAVEKIKNIKDPILVTFSTEPTFVPLFGKLKGVVTEVGSILSHAAIVSREFGIPCVVGCENATQILKDKMKIQIDGITGEIKNV